MFRPWCHSLWLLGILGGALILVSLMLPPAEPTVSAPPPTPWPSPPPPQNRLPVARPPEPKTLEESLRLREQLRQGEGRNDVPIAVAGPETRGSSIGIKGKTVQLPPDAWVETWMVFATCPIGRVCRETPLYSLRRGESTLVISSPSGIIYEERIAPGEEGAFAFVRDALR